MNNIVERPAYQQRVLEEHRELSDKVNSLHKFAESMPFALLGEVEKSLLTTQLIYMKSYLHVLEERISIFNRETK